LSVSHSRMPGLSGTGGQSMARPLSSERGMLLVIMIPSCARREARHTMISTGCLPAIRARTARDGHALWAFIGLLSFTALLVGALYTARPGAIISVRSPSSRRSTPSRMVCGKRRTRRVCHARRGRRRALTSTKKMPIGRRSAPARNGGSIMLFPASSSGFTSTSIFNPGPGSTTSAAPGPGSPVSFIPPFCRAKTRGPQVSFFSPRCPARWRPP
jgi:hypothetical protein